MPRDYAKKKTARKKPAATPKKKESQSQGKKTGLIYLSIGLIVGLFVAFLVYLDKVPSGTKNSHTEFAHPSNQKETKRQAKEKKSHSQKSTQTQKSKSSPAKKAPQKEEPQFDFYTMLPDYQVEVNEPMAEKKTRPAPTPKEAKNNSKTESQSPKQKVVAKNRQPYQLQVGAFQSLDKADSMKARLAFLGIESNISIVWINSNKKIYRVRIGPSKDLKKLDKIRSQLRAQNINAIMQKAL